MLAIAAGEVIARGEGGRLEGIFLWLRHAPADTGLPFWVFSKYQHLSVLPTLKKGDRVQVGQVVALSGATGTEGKHYGSAGYPHLHLGTHYGPRGEHTIRGRYASRVRGEDSTLDDPLIFYLQGVDQLDQVRELPDERKKIAVAVVGEDGSIYPPGSKRVWPVGCNKK